MQTQIRHYVNLTNGVEALADLCAAGAAWSFMRLQSTTIERQDWIKLFMCDVSDDLLMHLALGWRCVVHDRGTRRPLSKTIYYGLPLIKYVLDRRWYGIDPDEVMNRGRRGGVGMNVVNQYREIFAGMFVHSSRETGPVKRRVDYFKRYSPPRRLLARASCSRARANRPSTTATTRSMRRRCALRWQVLHEI